MLLSTLFRNISESENSARRLIMITAEKIPKLLNEYYNENYNDDDTFRRKYNFYFLFIFFATFSVRCQLSSC